MTDPVSHPGFLAKRYGLDLRSLALFRIGLAFVIGIDLITRMGDLRPHYTDQGVLPRPAAMAWLSEGYWSIHLLSGHLWGQALIFLAAIALALAMLVGYRTRLATIASWALLISLHNRNPALIFAADDVLRAVMFWAMFLPLGARYSIDSALNPTPQARQSFLGVATLALMVQQCFIYMFSAFFKTTSSTWWPEGSAVYYALSFDQYVTPLGAWLLHLGSLLPLVTFITLLLEWVGPLFLFVPIRTSRLRNLAIITFILLHLGFGLTLHLGIFPLLSIVTWLAFMPTSTWEHWSKHCYGQPHWGLAIYYDADCGFCKKMVHLIRTFLCLWPTTPLQTAQGHPDIFAAMERQNSWVVVDEQGHYHYKFAAIAYVCSVSPVFWMLAPVLRWPPIMAAGNRFYEAIANNRRRAGLLTRPFKFHAFKVKASWISHSLAAIFLLLTSVWNLRSITNHRTLVNSNHTAIQALRRITHSRTANRLHPLVKIIRLDQGWSIFSPSPPRDDGWYVITGTLQNGTTVNVLQPNQPIAIDKPTLAQRQAIYQNLQWRTYFINLNRNLGEKLYPYYGHYVCRNWNRRYSGNQRLRQFSVTFMDERTVPPGEVQTVDEIPSWHQSCATDAAPTSADTPQADR